MAGARRRNRPALIESLFAEPHRFEFFQAALLLERTLRARSGHRTSGHRGDGPAREVIRFRAVQSRAFPGTEVAGLTILLPAAPSVEPPPATRRYRAGPAHRAQPAQTANRRRRRTTASYRRHLWRFVVTRGDGVITLPVTFLGLTGTSGVLPLHYTDAVVQSSRRRNQALRDFFDIFNHRAISLFYRAWQKYRLPAARILAPATNADSITAALFALIGFGTPKLRNRLSADDTILLHFSGLLARQPRTAVGLEAILTELLGQPVDLTQFRSGWLAIGPDDQSCLPSASAPDGRYCRLGVDAVVGARVWDVQGAFRLKIGPLPYRQFARFLPDRPLLKQIADITRLYVGPAMSFDVQVILARDEVPGCGLGIDGPYAPRLGWNSWLKGAAFTADADDAVFDLDHL